MVKAFSFGFDYSSFDWQQLLKSLLEEGARSHFEGKREVFIAIY
jgi:hypothetical protein